MPKGGKPERAKTGVIATKTPKGAASKARSIERKAARVAAQNERHTVNVKAGKAVKVRKRKADNMRLCLRCTTRTIVAGSVCWCKSIGADYESRKAAR